MALEEVTKASARWEIFFKFPFGGEAKMTDRMAGMNRRRSSVTETCAWLKDS